MNPRFPLYIPSKSRADIATTPRVLEELGVPFRIVVEASQVDAYAKNFGRDRILVLDPAYQEVYDSCDEHGLAFSKGSGPARNFIWDHAVSEGHEWHWIMDDNIRLFARLHKNQRIPVGDGTLFHAMETFCLRYQNVGMAGPNYWMFALSREKLPPFTTGTRIFSCNLIRNDLPFRWRGRYNEDLDLSIRLLKAGWNTVLFNAFLQYKVTTQVLPGGNTEAFYSEKGTLPKSRMIVDLHPDIAKLSWRWNRWHHHVDFSRFKSLPLTPRKDYIPDSSPRYRFRRVPSSSQTSPGST